MSSQAPLNVTIEKLVYEGPGLGRLPSGEIVLVPWSAPGDTLMMGVTERQRRVLHGVIQRVITPSPHRITPRCSVFGQCGGCHWQHLPIEEQRRWKTAIVQESLQRLGKFQGITVAETLGNNDAWTYRNKVEWVVFQVNGRPQLGYSRFKSHIGLTFESCEIIPPRFNVLAKWLQPHLSQLPSLTRIQVKTNGQGHLLLTFSGDPSVEKPLTGLLPQLTAEFPELTGVLLRSATKEHCLWGQPFLMETVGPMTFRVSATSFFQINPSVTLQMLSFLETLLPQKIDALVDLYAGVGLFALWLHARCNRVVAIESALDAIADAQTNLALNKVSNVTMISGYVEQQLASLEDSFDVAIIDPPRNGCDTATLNWLDAHVTGKIIYVSCNPATLARDLKALHALGWQIETVQPFDMFPQTYHIETVVSLTRGERS